MLLVNAMKIVIKNKQSIYLEVADKIESFINMGIYKENEKLPSCRNLAVELNVNPNTIERAYRTLEEKGVIYTISKKGVFVSSLKNRKENHNEIKEIIKHCKEQNIEKEELLKIIDEIYEGDELK